MPKSEKFPIRELRIPGVSGWEYNKFGNRRSTQKLVDSVRLTRLQPLAIELLNEAREPVILIRSYFLHYRLIRAAARGDSLTQVVEVAVQELLDSCSADRAGLWLAGERRGEAGWGRVVEAKRGPIPEQWKHLDIATPFLRAALESRELLRVEIGRDDTIPHLGPLVGMHDAIWVPLRAGARTLGLAMVGYACPQSTLQFELESLRAQAEEVALAVAHYSDARKRELAAEELRGLARLSRAILCGVSVDSILPQIARAARHHMQAEFVVLGRPAYRPCSRSPGTARKNGVRQSNRN